ncbi:hypothetical protein J2W48_004191 [Flavobacterium piscis]|uniref:Permease n=1 Tax=Flavobacterium piscis TaxID=1114874 RepID=A0ABU1YDB9_9FLAO|nr:hypothetical protein [Flavobacterium piscis]
MEKIKEIFRHFLLSELISILIALIFGFFLIGKDPLWLFFFILGSYIFYISKWNLFLSFIFYYINENITKIISLISILILLLITIYLFSYRDYYQSLSLDKYPNSFMRENIDNVLIFLSLIINQLSVKFYYIFWEKMKKT